MSETFTPGPWRVNAKYPSEVDAPNGLTVASCWHEEAVGVTVQLVDVLDCSPEESIANAHLIAAAPDLYAALERLVAEWRGADAGTLFSAVKEADAALAKARGQ